MEESYWKGEKFGRGRIGKRVLAISNSRLQFVSMFCAQNLGLLRKLFLPLETPFSFSSEQVKAFRDDMRPTGGKLRHRGVFSDSHH